MGVLGKDLFDIGRPLTHVKVQFGRDVYWVEDHPEPQPYGAMLVQVLNGERCVLDEYYDSAEDVQLIQERYAWFLEELFQDAIPEKKKGQRKEPLAKQIVRRNLEAYLSGVSLGADAKVDAPPVNVQYAMLESSDAPLEIVEKMYFDRLADFVYVEFMKGLQKGFVPKRCPNCGRWFLQKPGTTYAYCDGLAPGETDKTCRDVGATASFKAKANNNEVWTVHQRAYKKYYARTMKKTLSKSDFEVWAREAEALRDEALQKYDRTSSADERKAIADTLAAELNRL